MIEMPITRQLKDIVSDHRNQGLRNLQKGGSQLLVPALFGLTRFRSAPSIGLSASAGECRLRVGRGTFAFGRINRRDKDRT